MGKPVLLSVDDDPGVSRAVARDLRRRYGEDFRVLRASSGAEALEALRELKLRGRAGGRPAGRLPDARDERHRVPRAGDGPVPARPPALLTAYADTDAAIQAINVVDVDHYLLKPWDPPEEKLYPVVDAMIETWREARTPPSRTSSWSATGGRRRRSWCATSWPATPCPTAGSSSTSRRGSGCSPRRGRPDDVRGDHARRDGARRADGRRGRRGGGLDDAGDGLLRPGRRRRRAGRPRRRRLRRVRGPAHAAGRAGGHRRPGRAERPDRELPGLPRRCPGASWPTGPAGRRRSSAPRSSRPATSSALEAHGSSAACASRRRHRSPRTPSSWPPGCPTASLDGAGADELTGAASTTARR